MNILYIDTSVQGRNSFSRWISARVMENLSNAHPDANVTYRDLGKTPVPHLTEASVSAALGHSTEHEPQIKADLALSGVLLDEFLSADIILIGAAFYNLTVSSALKAWIDRIVILNETFRYTAEGELIGLMGDKRIILCISRGGFYCEGTPGAAIEHCENYLRAVFGFIDVGQLDVVVADGVEIGPDHRSQAEASVIEQISSLKF